VDDRRFDAWTRSLVTAPHSRRRLLRLLVGAAVGAGLAGAGHAAERQAAAAGCGVGATPVAANSRQGKCQDLTPYRTQTGVTEADGTTHPGFTGWTRIKFESLFDIRGKGSRKKGKHCFRTEPVRLTFTAEPKVYRLDWQPPAGASAECKERAAAWAAQVDDHECHHVEDGRTLAQRATAGWIPKRYEACGGDAAAAKQKVKEQIEADARYVINIMETEFDRLRDAYHGTPEGGPAIDPNCDGCDECAPPPARARRRAGAAADQCCPTEWCGEDGRWCCPADRPYCCHGGCWQEGSIDCGGYCCPPRTTCCGPTQRCCAEGFVCKTDCPTNPPYACCRAGATCC
jgi:hypothetical protein